MIIYIAKGKKGKKRRIKKKIKDQKSINVAPFLKDVAPGKKLQN